MRLRNKIYFVVVRLLLCILILGCNLVAFGQESISPIPTQNEERRLPNLALSSHLGYVIAHHPEIRSLTTSHAKSFEISLEWESDGSKMWHKHYNFPTVGIDIFYSDLGNREKLGQQISMAYMINLPVVKTPRFTQSFKLGFGAGITTRTWDLDDNFQATAIGSLISINLVLQSISQFMINDTWGLRAGFRMHHFSNGAFTLPNLGTNNASVNFGVVRRSSSDAIQYKQLNNDGFDNVWSYSVFSSFGLREILPPLGKKYSITTLSAMASYRRTYKSSFGLAADVILNNALPDLISSTEDAEGKSSDKIRLGIAGTYTLHFDKITLLFLTGAYFKNEYKSDGWMYNKVTLRYQFSEKVFAGMGVKTHKTVANHIEVGFGLLLK